MSAIRVLKATQILVPALSAIFAFGQTGGAKVAKSHDGDEHSNSLRTGRIQVPNRPASSLFQGEQGKQKSEIHYDQTTGIVTIKMVVQGSQRLFHSEHQAGQFRGLRKQR